MLAPAVLSRLPDTITQNCGSYLRKEITFLCNISRNGSVSRCTVRSQSCGPARDGLLPLHAARPNSHSDQVFAPRVTTLWLNIHQYSCRAGLIQPPPSLSILPRPSRSIITSQPICLAVCVLQPRTPGTDLGGTLHAAQLNFGTLSWPSAAPLGARDHDPRSKIIL